MENTKNKFKDFIEKNKVPIGIYLIWFLLHFVLFFTNGGYETNKFWPFDQKSDLGDYDIKEFFFYTIIPILLFFIYYLLRDSISVNFKWFVRKYNISIIIVFIWILLNFIFLLRRNNDYYSSSYFWPFETDDIEDYGSLEFFVYSFSPIIILLIFYFLKYEIKKRLNNN